MVYFLNKTTEVCLCFYGTDGNTCGNFDELKPGTSCAFCVGFIQRMLHKTYIFLTNFKHIYDLHADPCSVTFTFNNDAKERKQRENEDLSL